MAEAVDTGPPLAPLDNSGWPSSPSGRFVFLLDAASGLEEEAARGVDRGAPAGRHHRCRPRQHRDPVFTSRRRGRQARPASRRAARRRRRPPARTAARLLAAAQARRPPQGALPRHPAARRPARPRPSASAMDSRRASPTAAAWSPASPPRPPSCANVGARPAAARAPRPWASPTSWRARPALALERAERRLRGTRYKVPRFVHRRGAHAAAIPGRRRAPRTLGRAARRRPSPRPPGATSRRSPPTTAPS